jgi:hypothetical protein
MYYRMEPTNLTLAEIANRIASEEARLTKFVESKVGSIKGASGSLVLKNMMKFTELYDQLAPALELAPGDAATFNGKKQEWSGVLVVKGSMTVVSLYR